MRGGGRRPPDRQYETGSHCEPPQPLDRRLLQETGIATSGPSPRHGPTSTKGTPPMSISGSTHAPYISYFFFISRIPPSSATTILCGKKIGFLPFTPPSRRFTTTTRVRKSQEHTTRHEKRSPPSCWPRPPLCPSLSVCTDRHLKATFLSRYMRLLLLLSVAASG